MQEFGIALVNITDGTVQGHKAGCADLKRGNLRKHADDVWEFDVTTKAEAWFSYNCDFLAEGGEHNGYEIQWAPCANHVPEGDQHATYVAAFESEQPETVEPAMSDEARANALANFSHLAETAPSADARAYWQSKVDAL